MANKQDELAIVVNDGSRRVAVRNQNGDEIGVFYFHPTDMGIVNRYNEFVKGFDSIIEPLEKISINADGTTSDESIEVLSEAEKQLYEAVNKLFNGDMAGAFFGSMHPFSPVDGRFYCEGAIEAVGQYIGKQFDSETDRFNKRIAKYTSRIKK